MGRPIAHCRTESVGIQYLHKHALRGEGFIMASGRPAHGPSVGSSEAEQRATATRPWWDGRQVAIRPDVPGHEFDAGDLVLVRNDMERDQINGAIDRYATEESERDSSDDELEAWLGKDPKLVSPERSIGTTPATNPAAR